MNPRQTLSLCFVCLYKLKPFEQIAKAWNPEILSKTFQLPNPNHHWTSSCIFHVFLLCRFTRSRERVPSASWVSLEIIKLILLPSHIAIARWNSKRTAEYTEKLQNGRTTVEKRGKNTKENIFMQNLRWNTPELSQQRNGSLPWLRWWWRKIKRMDENVKIVKEISFCQCLLSCFLLRCRTNSSSF